MSEEKDNSSAPEEAGTKTVPSWLFYIMCFLSGYAVGDLLITLF
jgi:hypothetical protein